MREIDKPVSEKSRSDIEKRLEGMGDYVKMSYLQRALKSGLDFETRKFVLIKLAQIYSSRKMFLDSARAVKSAAEIAVTFKEKSQAYMKAVEMYIKAGDFNETDRVFAQAVALSGNDREKREIKEKLKNFYLTQAKEFLNQDRRNNARNIYEKILTLELNIGERNEVQKTLLELHKRLGNIKEYYSLKEKIK